MFNPSRKPAFDVSFLSLLDVVQMLLDKLAARLQSPGVFAKHDSWGVSSGSSSVFRRLKA